MSSPSTERMLADVRAAAVARTRSQRALERAIVAAYGVEGVSLARIGRAAGLSKQRIYQIVKEVKTG